MAHADFLIVGAGTAGCVLAARLSEDPDCRVILVEAGRSADDPDIADPLRWPYLGGRPYDWAYRTLPQAGTNGRIHDWPRGRLIGGSSAINAMAHVRGHRDDFDAWAEAGGSHWSFDSLLPAFRRSERFSGGASALRGGDGPLPITLPSADVHPLVRAYMAAGLSIGAPRLDEHNAGPLAGVSPNQLSIRDGRRVTAADAYLAPALGRPNLTVLAGLSAERLLFERGRVSGLLLNQDGAVRTLEADQVILAAGAIGSPLLLMRSGIGGADDLRTAGIACRIDRPGVGRNLQDHLLAAGLVFTARQTIAPSRLQHSESLMYLHADDPCRADGAPDSVIACVTLPAVTERFGRPVPGTAFTLMFGFTHPESRGSIRPGGPLAADAPRIDPAYLSADADKRTFRKSFHLARRLAAAAPLAPWIETERLPGAGCGTQAEIDAFLADAATTHHHPCGTCRMGRDGDAVVDETLAVRGVDNLCVVDASVIPKILSGPINAAVTAIAEHWVAQRTGIDAD